jgi:hypothetical protein
VLSFTTYVNFAVRQLELKKFDSLNGELGSKLLFVFLK